MDNKEERALDLKLAVKSMLKIVTFEENNFSDALGINIERAKELETILIQALKTNKSYTEAIEDISNQVVNINELAFGVFYLGTHAGSEKASYIKDATKKAEKSSKKRTKGVVIESTTVSTVYDPISVKIS